MLLEDVEGVANNRLTRWAGRKTFGITKRATSFALNHPYVTAGTILSGMYATTHPIRRASVAIGNTLYNDPNAMREMAFGGFAGAINNATGVPLIRGNMPGLSANITTNGVTAGIATEDAGFSVNPNPDQDLRMQEQMNMGNPNPTGSIVFGLYNNRMK